MADKWAPGVSTLHGMMTSGFPNLFIMPAPGQQAVITANITLINMEGAEHIGATVKLLEERGSADLRRESGSRGRVRRADRAAATSMRVPSWRPALRHGSTSRVTPAR